MFKPLLKSLKTRVFEATCILFFGKALPEKAFVKKNDNLKNATTKP